MPEAFVPIKLDLTLLEKLGVIRALPSWMDVQTSRKNLRDLAEKANPYDQMDADKDNVIRYAKTLAGSVDLILYALLLAAHLSISTKLSSPSERMEAALRTLSEGLDLALLNEAETRSELERCVREFDHKLQKEVAEKSKALKTSPELWRTIFDPLSEKIRLAGSPPFDDTRAWDSWRNTLLAHSSVSASPSESGPNMNYLRCHAAGSLPGTILKARLLNATPREWSLAYIAGMREVPGLSNPCPPWFPYGVLAALGFGVSPGLIVEGPDADQIREFLSKLAAKTSRMGMIVIRSPSSSITDNWRDAKLLPTLIFTAEEYDQCKRFDLPSYFERKLNGILVEVAAGEKPDEVLKSPSFKKIEGRLPNDRKGFILPALPESSFDIPNGWAFCVTPLDPLQACSQAFPTAARAAAKA